MDRYFQTLHKKIKKIIAVIREEFSGEEWTQKIIYVNYKPQLMKRPSLEAKKDYIYLRRLCRILKTELSPISVLLIFICLIAVLLIIFIYKENGHKYTLIPAVIVGKYTTISNIVPFGVRIDDRFGDSRNVDYGPAKIYNLKGEEIERWQLDLGDVLLVEISSIDPGIYRAKKITTLGPNASLKEPITHRCPTYGVTVIDEDTVKIEGEVSYANDNFFNVSAPKDHTVYLTGKTNVGRIKTKYADCLSVVYESGKLVSVIPQDAVIQTYNYLGKKLFKMQYNPTLLQNTKTLPQWYSFLFPGEFEDLPASANSGACIVGSNVPQPNDPALGDGYAKIIKNDINTIEGLKLACTKTDFDLLLKVYCSRNNKPTLFNIIGYQMNGEASFSSCGLENCAIQSCP